MQTPTRRGAGYAEESLRVKPRNRPTRLTLTPTPNFGEAGGTPIGHRGLCSGSGLTRKTAEESDIGRSRVVSSSDLPLIGVCYP